MSVSTLPARAAIVDRSPESLAERMRRLRAEARASARDHTEVFIRTISDLETIATDIAGGGEAYGEGVREIARRLGPELETARLNVEALAAREG